MDTRTYTGKYTVPFWELPRPKKGTDYIWKEDGWKEFPDGSIFTMREWIKRKYPQLLDIPPHMKRMPESQKTLDKNIEINDTPNKGIAYKNWREKW